MYRAWFWCFAMLCPSEGAIAKPNNEKSKRKKPKRFAFCFLLFVCARFDYAICMPWACIRGHVLPLSRFLCHYTASAHYGKIIFVYSRNSPFRAAGGGWRKDGSPFFFTLLFSGRACSMCCCRMYSMLRSMWASDDFPHGVPPYTNIFIWKMGPGYMHGFSHRVISN